MINRHYYQQMGHRLRAIRKARGLTQAQLGAKVGVTGPTIFKIETVGRANLDDTKLARIAAALGVTVENVTNDGWREACGAREPEPKPLPEPKPVKCFFCTMCESRCTALYEYDAYEICARCLAEVAP